MYERRTTSEENVRDMDRRLIVHSRVHVHTMIVVQARARRLLLCSHDKLTAVPEYGTTIFSSCLFLLHLALAASTLRSLRGQARRRRLKEVRRCSSLVGHASCMPSISKLRSRADIPSTLDGRGTVTRMAPSPSVMLNAASDGRSCRSGCFD